MILLEVGCYNMSELSPRGRLLNIQSKINVDLGKDPQEYTITEGVELLLNRKNIRDITPILTADSDKVITNAPAFYNNKYKWFVFTDNIDEYTYLDELPTGVLGYIGYNFDEPKSLAAIKVRHLGESNAMNDLKIIASNDGIAWDEIAPTETMGSSNNNYWHTFLFNSIKTYKMFAVQFGNYSNYAKLGAIRFFELGA